MAANYLLCGRRMNAIIPSGWELAEEETGRRIATAEWVIVDVQSLRWTLRLHRAECHFTSLYATVSKTAVTHSGIARSETKTFWLALNEWMNTKNSSKLTSMQYVMHETSCYSNGSDGPNRHRHTHRAIALLRVSPHLMEYVVRLVHASLPQTAPRSVHPLSQDSRSWPTKRHKDHGTSVHA